MSVKDTQVDIDSIVDDLLKDSNLKTAMEVKTPSGKMVQVRPITFQEEKEFVSVANRGGDPANLLIDRCTTAKDKASLLLIDKIFLLFKLRELSFGSTYTFSTSCPACKAQQKFDVDLNILPVVHLEDSERVVTVTLPMCGKEVVVRRALMSDEDILSNPVSVMDNLWRFVDSFADNTDEMVIQRVIERLPAGDLNLIMSTITAEGYGLSTDIMFACAKCNHQSPMALPLSKDFFSAS